MPDPAQPGVTLYELERALKAADPAVLLTPSRILRRVIRTDRAASNPGLLVPHRKSYLIESDKLLTIADRSELGLGAGERLPATVILLDMPDPLVLGTLPRRQVMLKYWRLLFHACIHRTLRNRPLEDLQERIDQLGPVRFEEIRTVLHQERLLFDPSDDAEVCEEFAALFLELHFFDARGLPFYFPSLTEGNEAPDLGAELNSVVGASELFYRTRPRGAPDEMYVRRQGRLNEPEALATVLSPSLTLPARSRLHQRAHEAAGLGNGARAAILYAQLGESTRASDELDCFADRLASALHLDAIEREQWRTLLAELLAPAASGVWPVEERLLFDLQKVCIDRERDIYAVDVVEWACSFGRRPLRRLLPGHQEVLALKHLRNALTRLPSSRLGDASRRGLAQLLTAAIEREEHGLRDRFRPIVGLAIDDVALIPRNYPERIARHKLIEEVLDHVCERGFLTMGDLRDTLSRNQLKLADLSGVGEFIGGDCLIRLNRRLAVDLDGIYHLGEVYLRWLQGLSSLAFGTPVGRFLTRYVALPFGGAFIILKGMEEIVEMGASLVESAHKAERTAARMHLANHYSVVLLGFVLLALLYLPRFRQSVGDVLLTAYRGMHWLLLDVPRQIFRLPMLQRILGSSAFRACKQYLLKPLGLAVPCTVPIPLLGGGPLITGVLGMTFYLGAAIGINTRLGYALEETCADWLTRIWRQIEGDILPGLFWLILGAFRRLINFSEQMLYAVDEWLRFRQGDSRFSMIAKMILGVFWFFLTYFIRVFINLFVEPTFNPIKHFPVVTVAAKLIVPTIPTLVTIITATLKPVLGVALAGLLSGAVIFFLPGLAGFLVWELKENWRLYRANRSPTLRPALVGHHGETVTRLLKRGFHSGTVPKLYAKLRKDWRKAFPAGPWRSFRKHREALHDVEHAMHRFFEREFVELLHHSKAWGKPRLEVEEIHLECNRIMVRLRCSELGADAVAIAFTIQDGTLSAAILETGWLSGASAEQRHAFRLALAAQYKLAGTQIVLAEGRRDFAAVDLTWDEWLAAWEEDQAGKLPSIAILDAVPFPANIDSHAAPLLPLSSQAQ